MAEQRLIDAYKLMQAMYDRAFETDGDTMWQSGCWVRYRAVEQVIRAQPTIEERKTGKWIEIGTITHSYKCSVCGRMLVSIADGKNKVVEHYPFCHCGAKMEGEQP